MPAPLIGFFVAFLTGAALPVAGGAATLGGYAAAIGAVDRSAAAVTAIEEKVCPAASLAAAGLAAAAKAGQARATARLATPGGKHPLLRAIGARIERDAAIVGARLARDATMVCDDRARANTRAQRLAAAAKLLADLAKADGLVPAPAQPAAAPPPTGMCGRVRCR